MECDTIIVVVMSISHYCCDCQECHTEILVNLDSAHRPFGDQEKMLYRVVCVTCGLSYDVHFEDLRLCDDPGSGLAHRASITSFGRE